MSISTQDQAGRIDEAENTDTTEERPEEAPADSEPSLDVVFDVLRNRRRRLVLRALEEWEGSTTLSELAEHIGGIENDKSPDALNAQERKRVYVGLYQCHLPKMDDAGAIDFDKDRGTVERGEFAETYHAYLHRKVEVESPWPMYYGLIASAGLVLSVGLIAADGPAMLVSLPSLVIVGAVSVFHWIEFES